MELRVAVQKRWPGFNLDTGFVVRGERVGLFGASGSGKSTVVSLVAGLQAPDTGVITLDGETLFDQAKGVNLPPEKRRIGVVFQQPHLFPHRNVKENLLYGYKRCPTGERKIDVNGLLAILQLAPLLTRQVHRLSGGEQQRVAIGRAVLSNPRLLLLDESLSALDENLKWQIVDYLRSVCAAFAIPYLFISHSPREMGLMTDTVWRCVGGRVNGPISSAQLVREELIAQTRRENQWHPRRPLWADAIGGNDTSRSKPGGHCQGAIAAL